VCGALRCFLIGFNVAMLRDLAVGWYSARMCGVGLLTTPRPVCRHVARLCEQEGGAGGCSQGVH
jgi:hypothetical protein